LLIFVLYIFDKLLKILFILFLYLRLKQTLLAFAFFRENIVQLQNAYVKIFLLCYV